MLLRSWGCGHVKNLAVPGDTPHPAVGESTSVTTGSQGRDWRHDMMTRPLPAWEAEHARSRTREGLPAPPAEPARGSGVDHDGLRPRDDMPTADYAAPGRVLARKRRPAPGASPATRRTTPAQAPGKPHDKNSCLGPCRCRPRRTTRSARSDTDHEENCHPHTAGVCACSSRFPVALCSYRQGPRRTCPWRRLQAVAQTAGAWMGA